MCVFVFVFVLVLAFVLALSAGTGAVKRLVAPSPYRPVVLAVMKRREGGARESPRGAYEGVHNDADGDADAADDDDGKGEGRDVPLATDADSE